WNDADKLTDTMFSDLESTATRTLNGYTSWLGSDVSVGHEDFDEYSLATEDTFKLDKFTGTASSHNGVVIQQSGELTKDLISLETTHSERYVDHDWTLGLTDNKRREQFDALDRVTDSVKVVIVAQVFD